MKNDKPTSSEEFVFSVCFSPSDYIPVWLPLLIPTGPLRQNRVIPERLSSTELQPLSAAAETESRKIHFRESECSPMSHCWESLFLPASMQYSTQFEPRLSHHSNSNCMTGCVRAWMCAWIGVLPFTVRMATFCVGLWICVFCLHPNSPCSIQLAQRCIQSWGHQQVSTFIATSSQWHIDTLAEEYTGAIQQFHPIAFPLLWVSSLLSLSLGPLLCQIGRDAHSFPYRSPDTPVGPMTVSLSSRDTQHQTANLHQSLVDDFHPSNPLFDVWVCMLGVWIACEGFLLFVSVHSRLFGPGTTACACLSILVRTAFAEEGQVKSTSKLSPNMLCPFKALLLTESQIWPVIKQVP